MWVVLEYDDGPGQICQCWVKKVRENPELLKNYMPELFPEAKESSEKHNEDEITEEISKLNF